MGQYKYYTKKQGQLWFVKFRYIEQDTAKTVTMVKRGFATKREAKQYEENYLEELEHLGAIECTEEELNYPKSFRDVFDEYISSHKREDLKESTFQTKINIFEKHIFPTFGGMPIESITDDVIADWQTTIKASTYRDTKLSDSYLHTIQCQFNSVINYAFTKGYISKNPLADIKNMGFKDKRVDFWSCEEYERFAYEAMVDPHYYYCFEILYWCGMREGEMLALTLNDIDFDKKVITINKTYQRINCRDLITLPKTPSSVRKVSIPEFLVDEIKEYIAMQYDLQPDQRIFHNVSKTSLQKSFKHFTKKAGLRDLTIHGLRHSHVSLLISKKYDIFEVSKRIGHKSIKTTQDIYGHLFDDVQKTIANDLDNLRKG